MSRDTPEQKLAVKQYSNPVAMIAYIVASFIRRYKIAKEDS